MWITQATEFVNNYLSLHMEWIQYGKLILVKLRSDYLKRNILLITKILKKEKTANFLESTAKSNI